MPQIINKWQKRQYRNFNWGKSLHPGFYSVKNTRDNYAYQINAITPCPALTPFVECYWVLCTDATTTANVPYEILPDSSVNLVISVEAERSADGFHEANHIRSFMMGATTHIRRASLLPNICMLGIRFRPGGIYPLFKSSVSALTDKVFSLDTLSVPFVSELEERIAQSGTLSQKISSLECILLRWFDAIPASPQINFLVGAILKSKGQGLLGDIASLSSISHRQLDRYFVQYIGISPKFFSQTVRFYNMLQTFSEIASIDYVDLVAHGNYYDQAHFIREFKRFSGQTPGVYRADHLDVEFIQYTSLLVD